MTSQETCTFCSLNFTIIQSCYVSHVSKRLSFLFFFNNFVKNQLILIIFGVQHLEET